VGSTLTVTDELPFGQRRGERVGILDKVKEGAKTVGEKAQQGVKAGQEKIEDAKLKKKIENLKEEIGGIVYQQRTGGSVPTAETDIDRLVGEIKAAEAELQES
jgi:predicted AAA+ superfamily ATPase